MTTSSTSPGEPISEYALLRLVTEERSDGRIVETLVCYECQNIVERDAASKEPHGCSVATQQVATQAEREIETQGTAFRSLSLTENT